MSTRGKKFIVEMRPVQDAKAKSVFVRRATPRIITWTKVRERAACLDWKAASSVASSLGVLSRSVSVSLHRVE